MLLIHGVALLTYVSAIAIKSSLSGEAMSRMPVGFSNIFPASSDNLVQSVPANVVGDTNNIIF